jgi:hypothetical protein
VRRRARWWFLVLASLLVILFVRYPRDIMQIGYRIMYATAQSVPVFATENWVMVEEGHFRLYYQPADQAVVADVADDLEASLLALRGNWDYGSSRRPIVVFLYPSQKEMADALAGAEGLALGAYRLGRLYLLSPLAWQPQLSAQAATAFYAEQGPVVHELVHLLLDQLVAGNTPLWFSEGLAQYWELQIKGYLWCEQGMDWRSHTVPLEQLDQRLQSGDAYAAYRQSLSLVAHLYDAYGDSAVEQIVVELSRGRTMEQAMILSIGVDRKSFETEWRATLSAAE